MCDVFDYFVVWIGDCIDWVIEVDYYFFVFDVVVDVGFGVVR